MRKFWLVVNKEEDRMVLFEPCERGYSLGCIEIEGVNFHVEAIQLRGPNSLRAVNPRFQNRIDAWLAKNDDERPKTVMVDGRPCFVHVEVYAR